MSWSTSELRVRLAPLNRFKPSSKIFYWPFQGGTSFVDLLCFCSVLCLLCFVRVYLYLLRGHLLGKGWPLGSRLWCLLWVCHFPIGILGQVWYLIVSIPDLCNLTYFKAMVSSLMARRRAGNASVAVGSFVWFCSDCVFFVFGLCVSVFCFSYVWCNGFVYDLWVTFPGHTHLYFDPLTTNLWQYLFAGHKLFYEAERSIWYLATVE